MTATFAHPRYTIRRKVLRLFGGAFHLYSDAGELVLYSDMKRFRIREDIRLYRDASKRETLLRIRTRSVLDFAGAYDVEDTATGERIGTLKRAGLKSAFLRDHWSVLDPQGREIASLQEDSILKALLRRYIEFLSPFFPQRYHATVGGQIVAHYRQRFNPFILKLDVDFTPDTDARLDRRLGVAAGVLLSAIEGRQE